MRYDLVPCLSPVFQEAYEQGTFFILLHQKILHPHLYLVYPFLPEKSVNLHPIIYQLSNLCVELTSTSYSPAF